MKYGERKYEGATCLVSNCLAVPKKMQKDIREISQVYCEIDKRSLGHATEMLKAICKEADSKRMILVLSVGLYGVPGLTVEQLTEWYSTAFDFHVLQQEPLMLVRMFNPFPESGLTEKVGQIITEGCR